MFSIIIPSLNNLDYLKQCLSSLKKNSNYNHEKLPQELQHVLNKKENFQVLKNNTEDVKKFVKNKV